MKNKILIFVVFVVILLSGFKIIKAETNLIKEELKGVYLKNSSEPFYVYSIEGHTTYCIEPNVGCDNILDNPTYLSYEGLTNSPYSEEINEKLELVGYYGYDYPGHQTDRYRMATQALIWETINSETIEFWTGPSGSGNKININEEKDEINRLIKEHYILPSINGETKTIGILNSVKFTDSKNKLSDYEIFSSVGATSKISNNTLTVTPNTDGEITVILKRKSYTNNPSIIYLGENPETQKMAYFGINNTFYISVKVKSINGKVELIKTDQFGKGIENMRINVYDARNELYILSALTDSDGYALLEYLSYGSYYFIEKETPEGYIQDTEKHYFTIDENNLYQSYNLTNEKITGFIELYKRNENNNIFKGNSTLKGAIYYIYKNNRKVGELITDDNGYAISSRLDYGEYTIKEITSSPGYLLDPTEYKVKISNIEETITINSQTEIINFSFSLVKTIDNSERGTSKTEEDAEFNIYWKNNNYFIGKITTDNNGKATTTLPYGTYEICQIKGSKNTNLSPCFDIEINSNIEKVINSEIITGFIELYKKDTTNNNIFKGNATLKGAIYYIYKNGDKISELITDDNGYAISERLEYGEYTIKEISSSPGYLLDQKEYKIKISNFDETIAVDSQSEITKFDFTLIKTIGNSERGTREREENAEFNIYLKSNDYFIGSIITNKNGLASTTLPYGTYKVCQIRGSKKTNLSSCLEIEINSNIEKTINSEIIRTFIKVINIDSKTKLPITIEGIKFKIKNLDTNEYICDTNICEFNTNKDDILNIPFSLEASRYSLEEVDNYIKGYLWNSTPIIFEINNESNLVFDANIGNILELQFENEEVLGKIIINSMDEIINIKNGSFTYKEIPSKNVKLALYDASYQLITTITTDEFGNAYINDLKLGKYFLKIIKQNNDDIIDDNYYEIVLKYVDQYINLVEKEINLVNKMKKGTLEFTKKDSISYEGIPNTQIEIYTINEELIFSGITNKLGQIIIELPIGKYYLMEVDPVNGYVLDNNKIYFEIEDNQTYKISLTNNKIIFDIPKTYTDEETIINSLSIISMLIGGLFIKNAKKYKI